MRTTSVSTRPVLATICVGFFLFVLLTQSLRSALPDHGDYGSDMNILNSAESLQRDGFLKLRLGMTFDDRQQLGFPPWYYTHWPSTPALIMALMMRLGWSTPFLRVVPLLVTTSAIVAFYLLIRAVSKREGAALVACISLVAAAPIRLLADSFTYMSYDISIKAWAFYVLLKAAKDPARKWAILSGVMSALAALSGFELIPVILVMAVMLGTLFPREKKFSWRTLARILTPVGFGLATGLFMHFIHWVWMDGSSLGALNESFRSYQYRRIYFPHYDRSLAREILHRIRAYYPVHLLVIGCGLPLLALAFRRLRQFETEIRFGTALLLSEIAWVVFLPDHVHLHTHTSVHWAFSFAFASSMIIYFFWDFMRRRWQKVAFAGVLSLLAVIAFLDIGIKPYFNLQIQYNYAQEAANQLNDIDRLLPKDAVVIEEVSIFEPRPQYFLSHPVIKITSKDPGSVEHPSYIETPTEEEVIDELRTKPLYLLRLKPMDLPPPDSRFGLVKETTEWLLYQVRH
jgi:hypothetical protein